MYSHRVEAPIIRPQEPEIKRDLGLLYIKILSPLTNQAKSVTKVHVRCGKEWVERPEELNKGPKTNSERIRNDSGPRTATKAVPCGLNQQKGYSDSLMMVIGGVHHNTVLSTAA